MNIHIIVLAGGKGVRMNSDVPKMLHKAKGAALIDHVLNSVLTICRRPTIIIGYEGEKVIQQTKNKYHYIEQKEQLGTGQAVLCAKDSLIDEQPDAIMVLPGDLPCIKPTTLEKLAQSHIHKNAELTLTTAIVPYFKNNYSSFYDYGRIIRDKNQNVVDIVELKDADEEQKNIKEVNVGLYCFDPDWLWGNITKLTNNNKAKEYYLTDIVKIAKQQNLSINSIIIDNPIEAIGVNTPEQLKLAEQCL